MNRPKYEQLLLVPSVVDWLYYNNSPTIRSADQSIQLFDQKGLLPSSEKRPRRIHLCFLTLNPAQEASSLLVSRLLNMQLRYLKILHDGGGKCFLGHRRRRNPHNEKHPEA